MEEERQCELPLLINKKTNKKGRNSFDLHDEFDVKTKTSSMARTTGYTATAAVNMFLEGFKKDRNTSTRISCSFKPCYDYFFSY